MYRLSAQTAAAILARPENFKSQVVQFPQAIWSSTFAACAHNGWQGYYLAQVMLGVAVPRLIKLSRCWANGRLRWKISPIILFGSHIVCLIVSSFAMVVCHSWCKTKFMIIVKTKSTDRDCFQPLVKVLLAFPVSLEILLLHAVAWR